jgi:hypothetical protein
MNVFDSRLPPEKRIGMVRAGNAADVKSGAKKLSDELFAMIMLASDKVLSKTPLDTSIKPADRKPIIATMIEPVYLELISHYKDSQTKVPWPEAEIKLKIGPIITPKIMRLR